MPNRVADVPHEYGIRDEELHAVRAGPLDSDLDVVVGGAAVARCRAEQTEEVGQGAFDRGDLDLVVWPEPATMAAAAESSG